MCEVKTWKGEHFEYHGQCDMVLTKDDTFANDLGLELQIRTKLIRFWSYIRSAAIRIGDDILEIEGSEDPLLTDANNQYWINFEYQGELTTLGGFPVKYHLDGMSSSNHWMSSNYPRQKIARWFEIDLSSKSPGQKIVISTFREFVRVDFQNGSDESFGNSVGMLGDFRSGKTLGRDAVTELDDFSMLGNEWQVLPDENMLFHDISKPQFPEKCIEPEDPRGERRRRRLGETSITEAQAEAACASIEDALDRKDCVYDVLATQDIGMVGAY
jgi:hypothetical protein